MHARAYTHTHTPAAFPQASASYKDFLLPADTSISEESEGSDNNNNVEDLN